MRAVISDETDWEQFVLAHGARAWLHELAAVVGQVVEDVERVRRTRACKPLRKRKSFSELFSLWHGRAPEEADWPAPRKLGGRSSTGYEWQAPELALLASLVGHLSVPDIAQALTARLRERTGDPAAKRTRNAVQGYINKIGLQAKDVLGGLTAAEAGREIGSLAIIQQAIAKKQLPTRRVGHLVVIPYDAWEAWKGRRVFPPEGYVLLSTIREELSIRSDKLSEFARMGYVPTAMRCNPYGTKGPSTQFGTWYVDKKVADQLLADRRAGRPMPWHGKPILDNLRATFRLWEKRKHPEACKTCAGIWGKKGAPQSFEDYATRYPPLAHGAKRHLTRVWTPGMTIQDVARFAGCSATKVQYAINNGMLESFVEGGRQYISRTDVTRWKARKCPTGDGEKSWISLDTAQKQYFFTHRELKGFVSSGKLKSKIGTDGPMRGVVYVSRHQCGRLREQIGFTEGQAARRVGVSVQRFRVLLEGANWRKAKGIPLVTVQAVIKRLESREGYTIEEAAEKVGESVQWVLDRKKDGTIKVARAPWDRRRTYITEPMLRRLMEAKQNPVRQKRITDDWLLLSEAAHEAGVTAATIIHWAERGELDRQKMKGRWRYHRDAVRARARTYWPSVRFHRATPPEWLRAELADKPRIPRSTGGVLEEAGRVI